MIMCLHCEKTDQQVPLLRMIYRGEEILICPQCLPVLIHKPEKLDGKLPGMQAGSLTDQEH